MGSNTLQSRYNGVGGGRRGHTYTTMFRATVNSRLAMNEELNSKYDEKCICSHVLFLFIRQQKSTGNSTKYLIFLV